jgi:hypothetical protein
MTLACGRYRAPSVVPPYAIHYEQIPTRWTQQIGPFAKAHKRKNHPAETAMVFLLLPDCPLRWAQYLSPLQSVLHGDRATSYRFWSTST